MGKNRKTVNVWHLQAKLVGAKLHDPENPYMGGTVKLCLAVDGAMGRWANNE